MCHVLADVCSFLATKSDIPIYVRRDHLVTYLLRQIIVLPSFINVDPELFGEFMMFLTNVKESITGKMKSEFDEKNIKKGLEVATTGSDKFVPSNIIYAVRDIYRYVEDKSGIYRLLSILCKMIREYGSTKAEDRMALINVIRMMSEDWYMAENSTGSSGI